MESLTTHDLDDDIKTRLRISAARHHQSIEQEVRDILRQALGRPERDTTTGLGQRLRRRFAALATDLSLPQRSLPRTGPFGSEFE